MSKKRKTRQEKIITDLRRRLETVQTKSVEKKIIIPKEETLPLARLETPPSPSPISISLPPTSYGEATSSAYIKKDLTKTAALSILAISLELVLYFLLG